MMMISFFLLLLVAAAVLILVVSDNNITTTLDEGNNNNNNNNNNSTDNNKSTTLPACPQAKRAKYHYSSQCGDDGDSKKQQQQEEYQFLRNEAYTRLLKQGLGVTNVPNEETIICPSSSIQEEEQLLLLQQPQDEDGDETNTNISSSSQPPKKDHRRGLNKVWLVENLSSQSIVVYLAYSNGKEVNVTTTTVGDPSNSHAIIYPGSFLSIPTYEGYVYNVRTYTPYDDTTNGKLVLQHRVGLVPIRWSKNSTQNDNIDKQYNCRKRKRRTITTKRIKTKIYNKQTRKMEIVEKDVAITTTSDDDENDVPASDLDNEPLILEEETEETKHNNDHNNNTELKTDPKFARTPTPTYRRCNTIDIGFRNGISCPVHVYWAGGLLNNETTTTTTTATASAAASSSIPRIGDNKICNESFQFHLGVMEKTQDFMRDWKSTTKWEGTMVGHTFIARLAKNESIVVDTYTVQPTRVYDCHPPSQKISSQQQQQKDTGYGKTTTSTRANPPSSVINAIYGKQEKKKEKYKKNVAPTDENYSQRQYDDTRGTSKSTTSTATSTSTTTTTTTCEIGSATKQKSTQPSKQQQEGIGRFIRKWLDNGRMDRHYL